jgi:hypothetical protein
LRQRHQGDVVMPAAPATHFIVGEAQLALGFAEAVFDPVALGLHEGQPFPGSLRRGVAQAVFEGAVGLLAHDEQPGADLAALAIPQPHGPHPDPGVQETLAAGAQGHAPALAGEVALHQGADFVRGGCGVAGLRTGARAAGGRVGGGHAGLRMGIPHPRVVCDIQEEGFAGILQLCAECLVVAIDFVAADPGMTAAPGARGLDHLQG